MSGLFVSAGTGSRSVPGFIGIDQAPGADLQVDRLDELPFDDGSVAGILVDHIIEHRPRPEAIAFLNECRRILAPGGVLRLVTPDLSRLVTQTRRCQSGPLQPNDVPCWTATRSELFNTAMRLDGRQWLYDEEELIQFVCSVGLAPKRRRGPGESDVPQFQGTGLDQDDLVLEAVSLPVAGQAAQAPEEAAVPDPMQPGTSPFGPFTTAITRSVEIIAAALPELDPQPEAEEQARLNTAERLRDAGAPGLQQAYDALHAALAERPGSVPLRLGLADVLLEAGEPAAALDVLAAGMAAPPRWPSLYLRAGIAALLLRQDVDARGAFIIAQSLAPESDAPRLGRDALRLLEALRRLTPREENAQRAIR